jgi:hypothetical protein
MGFKYQVNSCASPQQILHVTLNHLEAIKLIAESDAISVHVRTVIDSVINIYTSFTNSQWMMLYQTLMCFFQARKTKVSLFLQRNLQGMDGNLMISNSGALPFGTERPGKVRYFEDGVMITEKTIYMDGFDDSIENFEIFDVNSLLGYNMYSKKFFSENFKLFESVITAGKEMKSHIGNNSSPTVYAARKSSDSSIKSSAKAELNFLADLLGMSSTSSKSESDAKPFKINLFPDNIFDEKGSSASISSSSTSNMIMIDIDGTADAKTVQQYMADLKLRDDDDVKGSSKKSSKNDDDDDLLALMDSAK